MRVFSKIEDLQLDRHCVVTIGTFDGVHVGHKKILSRVKNISKETGLASLVFTFEPHPRTILFPEQKDLKLLTTREEKASLLEAFGIDYLLEYPFTKEFSQIDSLTYVKEILVGKLKMKKLVIGYDHRFGKNREGSIHTLKEMSTELGFEVEEIPAQDVDEINVSSTRIRRALEEGNINIANSYLGYPFFMTGTVVEGKKLGRTIGFPTANIELQNDLKLIPRVGVYAVEVTLRQAQGDNNAHQDVIQSLSKDDRKLKGMMSIGVNPTTDNDNKIKIEVNIFDLDENLYNKKLRVSVIQYIRPELKFDGLEELKKEIENDKKKALSILAADFR